jgi:alanyl aminopeptidase
VEVVPHDDGTVTITQKRLGNYGVQMPPCNPWYIPMVVSYAAGDQIKHQPFVLQGESATLDLGTDGPPLWVFPHADARGYYRWSAPANVLRVLAEQSTDVMTPRERVGFLGNLSALLDAGTVEGDVYLDVVHRFGNDPDPQVISAVLSALERVRSAFVADSLKPAFGRYIQATLDPALARFGLTPKPGEEETVPLVRPRLIGQLADLGREPRVLAFAGSVFEKYMVDPLSVDPELISVSVGLACRNGDRALFDRCRQRFETAEAPDERRRFLAALGSFEDPVLQEEALAYTLEGPIRPQEVFTIPGTMSDYSDLSADRIFQWMMANYPVIVARMPPLYRSYMPFFAGGCSRERVEAARAFFAEPEHQAPGVELQMARVADQVSDCTTLREREGASVAAYLAKFDADRR